MKNTKLIAALLFPLCLSGCAMMEQMHQEWLKENCNTSAAYQAGMTDGLTPGKMPVKSFAHDCPTTNINEINNAYMNGFSKGIKGRPKEVIVNKD